MNTTTPLDSFVADTASALNQPGMGLGAAVWTLDDLVEAVESGTLQGRLHPDHARTLAAALEVALQAGEAYDPAATSWYNHDDDDDEGDIEFSPILNLIGQMQTLGLPMIQLHLDDAQKVATDFLELKRPVGLEYAARDLTTSDKDVTDLSVEWVRDAITQLTTDPDPECYVRITMPNTAWSFSKEQHSSGEQSEVFFAFGPSSWVLAGFDLNPTTTVEERGDTITLHEVDFKVNIFSMLDNCAEPLRMSEEVIDAALDRNESVTLKSLTYDRTSRTFIAWAI